MIKLSDGHGNMKNRSISRLVAKAYVPNPENKPYVLHLDNNPLNNPFSNLKWGTQAENMQQMARDGRSTKGRVRLEFIEKPLNTYKRNGLGIWALD